MKVKLESNSPLLDREVHTREKILVILSDRVDINDLRKKMNISSIGAYLNDFRRVFHIGADCGKKIPPSNGVRFAPCFPPFNQWEFSSLCADGQETQWRSLSVPPACAVEVSVVSISIESSYVS